MIGGSIPGGINARIALDPESIWAIARSTLTLGWKNIFSTEMPSSDWLSMLRMSLTLELYAYSLYVATRRSISSGVSPVYCQITDTTGMLIMGKMSLGVVRIALPPRNSIINART